MTPSPGDPPELDHNAGKQVAIERFQREYLQRNLARIKLPPPEGRRG